MKRFTWTAAALWALAATPAWAQPGALQRPFNPRPAFSPYLNLNRGGNAAINYYGLVRPQVDTSKNLQQLQGQLQGLTAAGPGVPMTPEGTLVLPITGHPVAFSNWSHYYATPGFRTGGGGIGGPIATGIGAGFGAGTNIGVAPVITTGTIRR